MKTPHLLASFAVAATAAAADLKDPAQVAREWSQPVGPAMITDFSLKGQSELTLPKRLSPPTFSVDQPRIEGGGFQFGREQAPSPKFRNKQPPKEPSIDIPGGYRIPDQPGGKMPPGAKEWKYGGQTYWLMPLIPSREK